MKFVITVLGLMGMLVAGTGCSVTVENRFGDESGESGADASDSTTPRGMPFDLDATNPDPTPFLDADSPADRDIPFFGRASDATAIDNDAVDATSGEGLVDVEERRARGFPRDDTLSSEECPQIVLPVLDGELLGSRAACALAVPEFEHVVDTEGVGVEPVVLKGKPTVLWFFPAPLTPG